MGWCRLRRLSLHGELVHVAWCPHWTAKAPALPDLLSSEQGLPPSGRQLELGSNGRSGGMGGFQG